MSRDRAPLTRRDALGLLGAFGAAALAGCSSSGKSAAGVASTTLGPRPTGSATTSCTLTPELTQGPYFLTDHPKASNLVQDRQGSLLALTLAVVGQSCAPIENAKVDIWHCDASGEYAGIAGGAGAGPPGGDGAATRGNPDTWLQGYQASNAVGTVVFHTIYPGWYPGRAVHIHVKVFVGGNAVHTGQLFFPDSLSEQVFARSPYRGTQDTLNAADSIYNSGGSSTLLAPGRSATGYAANARLVVS